MARATTPVLLPAMLNCKSGLSVQPAFAIACPEKLAPAPGNPIMKTQKIPEPKFWDLEVDQIQQKDLCVCCWGLGRGL